MTNGASLIQASECGRNVRRISTATVCAELDRAVPINSGLNGIESHKRPTTDKIAKDTGCCLYSAITVIVVMLVALGIVLIVTGPVMGLSIFPSGHLQPRLEHNLLVPYNSTGNETIGEDYADYHTEEYADEDYQWTDEVDHNATESSYAGNETMTAEELEKLSPEALRINPNGAYLAYVPIPVDKDDEDDFRLNGQPLPSGSSTVRRRPELNGQTAIQYPIVVVPKDESNGHLASGSDTRGPSISQTISRHDNSEELLDGEEDEDLNTSSESQESRRRFFGKSKSKQTSDEIDYSMFGTLAPQQRKRPQNQRTMFTRRPVSKQDDFGRVSKLPRRPNNIRHPPGAGSARPNGRPLPSNSKRPGGKQGQQGVRNAFTVTKPPLRPYLRAPPSHRIQTRYPQHDVLSTTKPLYSYPKDAMSIQDIISYMTSLGTSDDPETPSGSSHSGNVIFNGLNLGGLFQKSAKPSSEVQQQAAGHRAGHHSQAYRPHQQPLGNSKQLNLQSVRSRENPYSFMLDVYPVRDQTGSASHSSHRSPQPSSARTPLQQYIQHHQQLHQQQQQQQYADLSNSYPQYNQYADAPVNQQGRRPVHYSDPVVPGYRDDQSSVQQYRPRPTISPAYADDGDHLSPTAKPKLVVHLNVYNQKGNQQGGRGRYDDHVQHASDYDDVYYSPSDVYRAVLRNNAAKRDQYLQAGDDVNVKDDGFLGGQSRVSGYSHYITTHGEENRAEDHEGSVVHSSGGDPFRNHNMAVSPPEQNRPMRDPEAGINRSVNGGGHRPTNPIRPNSGGTIHHQHSVVVDEVMEVPEMLPNPLALETVNSTISDSTPSQES